MIKKIFFVLAVVFCLNGWTQCTPPSSPSLYNMNPALFCEGQSATLNVFTIGVAVWYESSSLVYIGNAYTPATNSPGTKLYTVRDSVGAGCVSTPLTVTVTVNPNPSPPVLNAPTGIYNTYCRGNPITLTVNAGSAIAEWYNGNTVVHVGSSYTIPSNFPVGTYTFSIIDSISTSGCISALASANTLTLTLIINPIPTLNVSGAIVDSALCGQANGGFTGISFSNIIGGTPSYYYLWFNSVGTVVGTSPSLSNVTGGTYSLQVTDANGCLATVIGGTSAFNIPSPNCTGISQYSNLNTNILVYPNPAANSVQVALAANSSNSIEIYNAICECVHREIATSSNCQIDIADLNEGIYTIRIAGNEGVVNKKLIIAR